MNPALVALVLDVPASYQAMHPGTVIVEDGMRGLHEISDQRLSPGDVLLSRQGWRQHHPAIIVVAGKCAGEIRRTYFGDVPT